MAEAAGVAARQAGEDMTVLLADAGSVGEAVRIAFLRQRVAPWRGMDFSGVNPPIDWEEIGAVVLRELTRHG